MDALDDLCVSRVAAHLPSARDLLLLGATSRRLRALVDAADGTWQHRIYADFGLLVQGTSLRRQYDALRRVAAGQPAQEQQPPLPPHHLHQEQRLQQQERHQEQQRSKPRQDEAGGGAGDAGRTIVDAGDAPAGPCSSASAGPSCRAGAAGAAAPRSSLLAAATAPRRSPLRPFLPFVGCITDGGCYETDDMYWVGHLFSPSVSSFYASEQGVKNIHCTAVLQPADHQPDGQPDDYRDHLLDQLRSCAAYLRPDIHEGSHDCRLPALPPGAEEEARRELSIASTEDLEELYVYAFSESSTWSGSPWGRLLPPGMHTMRRMREIARSRDPLVIRQADPRQRPRLMYTEPPLRALMRVSTPAVAAAGPVASGATAAAATSGAAERRPREGAAFGRTVGLFDTVLLGRPSPYMATCPMRCGALFAAVAVAAPGGSRRAADGAGGVEGSADGGGGGAAAALAAALTDDLASTECVKALSDAADARAVLSACRSGALPPAACYRTNGWIEWIEFQRPGGQQAHGGASASGGAGPSVDGSGAPAVLSLPKHGLRVRVLPVLWFRFYTPAEREEMRRSWASRAQPHPHAEGTSAVAMSHAAVAAAAAAAAAAPEEAAAAAALVMGVPIAAASAGGMGPVAGMGDVAMQEAADPAVAAATAQRTAGGSPTPEEGRSDGGAAAASGEAAGRDAAGRESHGVPGMMSGEGGDGESGLASEDGLPAEMELGEHDGASGGGPPENGVEGGPAGGGIGDNPPGEGDEGMWIDSDDDSSGSWIHERAVPTTADSAESIAAAAAAAANVALGLAAAPEAVAAGGGASGEGGGGGAGMVAQPVPCPEARAFPPAPRLVGEAPGVGRMYGWDLHVSEHVGQRNRTAVLQLQQPWCANLLLAKLIDCEDARPVANAGRGGCNIDAAVVAVQGPAAPGGQGGGPVVRLLDGVQLA